MRRAFPLLFSLPLLFLALGCQQGDGNGPLKIRKVTYRSIVSLSPSTSEILGQPFGVTLAGRSAADNYPENVMLNVPVVGGVKPDCERLTQMHPDLIVYDRSLYNEEDERKLKQTGASVYAMDAHTLADFRMQLFELASLIGQETRAQDYMGRIKEELNNAKATPPSPTPKVAVLIPGTSGSNMIAGTESFDADVVRSVGGEPVGPKGTKFVNVNPEALIALDPDKIIVSGKATDHAGFDAFIKDPRFQVLKAVKSGNVTVIDSDVLLREGSRVDLLVKAIYRAITAKKAS